MKNDAQQIAVQQFNSLLPEGETFAMDTSLDLLEAVGRAGLAVTPRRPTKRMIEAGRLAGNGDPAMALAIYRAMIDATE